MTMQKLLVMAAFFRPHKKNNNVSFPLEIITISSIKRK